MKYGLPRGTKLAVNPEIVAGVRITIVTGEVAGRDFQAQTMTRLEHVARCPEVNCIFVDPVGYDGRWCRQRFPEAGAEDAFDDIVGVPVGPNVTELGGEI